MSKLVENVYDYIQELNNNLLATKWVSKGEMVVFRGHEDLSYRAIPSLFREPRLNCFEYDQIHFLKASRFVQDDCDLEIAIQAQHYGYPTRLLDVTYNSLVALFFSCYGEHRDEDGQVLLIKIDRYLPPTSPELQELYHDIISNSGYFQVFSESNRHIIVENIKNNDRIIAQHGAFIIFLAYDEISEMHIKRINIPKTSKEMLLKELNDLFNINEGTIFPDITKNISRFKKLNEEFTYSGSISQRVKFRILHNYIEKMKRKCMESIKDSSDPEVTIGRFERSVRDAIEQYYKDFKFSQVENMVINDLLCSFGQIRENFKQ